MKRFSLALLGVLVVGLPFLLTAPPQADAQFARFGAQSFADPEEMFEDNPARRQEAAEEGKTFVPDISALGFGRQNGAARNEIRFDNVRPKADLRNAGNDFKGAEFGAKEADKNAQEAPNQDEKAFEFNHMVGNEKFNADLHGVPAAEMPMSVETGRAALDKNMNLDVGVKGLRFQDGQSAAGMKLKAGVACMDSGAFMAKAEGADEFDNSGEGSFEVDGDGNAAFKGHMDFAGSSCVAPTPMITDEQNRFIAIGANADMADKRAALEEKLADLDAEDKDAEDIAAEKEDLQEKLMDLEDDADVAEHEDADDN